MKYCSSCGKEIMDQAVVCPSCGCAVEGAGVDMEKNKSSVVLNIIGFLFPIIGLILYIVYHDTAPVRAKAIGKWALIGFLVGIAYLLISFVFGFVSLAMYY